VIIITHTKSQTSTEWKESALDAERLNQSIFTYKEETMEKHDTVNGVPVLSWCPNPEQGAINQVVDAAKHPAVFKHVALMPDAHQGYGVPIGSVVALENAVSPNMVGVDIGCGMRAVKTSLTSMSKEYLNEMLNYIGRKIPVGMNSRREVVPHNLDMKNMHMHLSAMSNVFSSTYLKKAEKSIGTLGGGNHFIEFQQGDDGYVWIMIHSGSRNLGYKIAEHFNFLATQYNKLFHTERNGLAPDLAFLPMTLEDGADYFTAMEFALDYAKENRRVMMEIITDELSMTYGGTVRFELDVHHNYAAHENHFGKNVWVHRKGATSAREGQLGIIPGSMGTKSYIVEGLGNIMSFNSCSHGAGRVKSRTAATLELDVEVEREVMKNIVHEDFKENKRGNKKVRGKLDLGEASGAYKDIDEVMQNQSDLVKIHTELTPLMVVKG
jgi:tRNA-splicing ligase RtcB